MPALRERPDDIPLLIEHFLRRCAAQCHRPGVHLSRRALDWILSLPWKGNVRQLEELVSQAFRLAEGDVITEQDLSQAALAIERAGGVSPLQKAS